MSIAILAFLKDEHKFYDEQRFLWALFSVILCLDRTAGSSTLRLLFRFFATFASMVASYVIWWYVFATDPYQAIANCLAELTPSLSSISGFMG